MNIDKGFLVGIDRDGRKVFVNVKVAGEGDKLRLSMTGHAPSRYRRNDFDYCGQIKDVLRDGDDTITRWLISDEQRKSMIAIWDTYHLNDMKAACEHQRTDGKTWKTNPSDECAVCGWKLGHGWAYMPIPEEVFAIIEGWKSGVA